MGKSINFSETNKICFSAENIRCHRAISSSETFDSNLFMKYLRGFVDLKTFYSCIDHT